MEDNKAPTPPASIEVKIDGQSREIFASFALVNKLAQLVGGIENLPLVQVNATMREAVLEELLQERDSKGKVISAKKLEDFDIAFKDIHNLLDFAAEHVLDFTLEALERAAALQARNKARVSNLKSIQTGLGS